MTFEEEQERKGKTYKLLLWFGMISICMIFAGLTSLMSLVNLDQIG